MSQEHKPPYQVQYTHKGRTCFCTIMQAENWDDAEQQIRSICYSGRVVGSNVQTFRTNAVTLPFVALWVPVSCWWRNLWRRQP